MIRNIGIILSQYGMVFVEGLWNTIWLSSVSLLMGTLAGVFVALAKMSRRKVLSGTVSAYIELIRGTPMLLQLYFFWLLLPKLLQWLDRWIVKKNRRAEAAQSSFLPGQRETG